VSFLARAIVLAAAATFAATANGCTFLLDSNTAQCETNTDCSVEARGSRFEGYVCGPQKTCLKSADYCLSNAECIDTHGGAETWICDKREGKHGCVNLQTKACPRLVANPGDLRNENAILVGFHWGAQYASELKMAENALLLARRDFAEQVQGVPPTSATSGPTSTSRPVVLVVCDPPPSEDDPIGQKVTDLLFDVDNVSVMIGPLFDSQLVYAIDKAVKTGKYVIAPRGLSSSIKAIPGHQDHALLVGPTTEFQSVAYAKIFDLHKQRIGDGNLKVALVTPNDADSANTVPFLRSLQFNGKDGIQNQADGKFEYYQFADNTSEQDPAFNATLAKLSAFQPNVIACRGTTCLGVFQNYERTNPGTASWILGFESTALFDFTKYTPTEESRKRILGLNVRRPETDERWQTFKFYFEPKFPDDPLTDLGGYLYDVGYMTHLTFAALGDTPITGKSFRDTLLSKFKIPTQPPQYTTGPLKVRDLINGVRSSPSISVGGPTLDFEITPDGELTNPPAEVWCVGKPGIPTAGKNTSSGLIFNRKDNALLGTMNCY
jgi:hypothetical protein